MSTACFLVLKSGLTLPQDDDVFPMLAAGATEDQLCAAASDLPRLFYLLEQLRRANLLEYELHRDGETIARLLPLSGEFEFQTLDLRPDATYVLSRFAYLRRERDGLMLESPLALARVLLNSRAVGELLSPLNPATSELVRLLAEAGFLETVGAPEPASLAHWEFHDLLFHARSRLGRSPGSVGGTYRLQGRIEPQPALKPPMSGHRTALDRPDLERLASEDPPFTRVLESRRSIAEPAAEPLTCAQLGEFLYRTAHIRQVIDASPQQLLKRAYPAAGAVHELEFYAAVHAVRGLAGGLYHYHAGEHALYRLPARDAQVNRLLEDVDPRPDTLIILASRFGRIAWKYEGMAYRLTLLNAGVVMQTMYLVAAAMGLAPCARGNGSPDVFAAATGLDLFEETSVAEFALSAARAVPLSPPAP
jgi:SagB-type dehydrogenase family enzyme